MALANFKEVYVDRYQDVFNKVLVAMKIANTRYQGNLTYGESVTRIKYDLSNVLVRDVTNLTDRTVDTISDSEETLNIDQKKGTTFAISSHEKTQAGPLNPAMVIGGQAAIKMATFVDADVLSETQNAHADFDNGDLTTLSSTGTSFALNSTNVPLMATRASAKLSKNNIDPSNRAWVLDSYAIAEIQGYILGKDIVTTDSFFKNGFSGTLAGADVFVSENLTGEAVLGLATNPTANDTVTVNGVAFTFVATLGSAGDLHICSSADATRANMANAFNAIGTAIAEATDTGYQVVSSADQATWNALNITATDSASANTLTLVAKGSGRLTVAETLTDGTDAWDKNFIHAYYGKKGAIDVVIQDQVDVEMRAEPKQRTDNVLSDVLYGKKTFNDGAQQFLDVMITA